MNTKLLSLAVGVVISMGMVSCGSGEKYVRSVDSIVVEAREELADGNPQRALRILCDSLKDEELLDSARNILTLGQVYFKVANTRDLITGQSNYGVMDQSGSAVLDKSGKLLTVTFFSTGQVKVYGYPSMNERLIVNGPSGVYTAKLSPDTTLLAIATADDNIYLFDYPSGNVRGSLEGHRGSVRDLAFANDSLLISVSNDHNVKTWNTNTLTETWSWRAHSKNIKAISLTPDGKMFGTSSNDGSIQTFRFSESGFPVTYGDYINVANNYVNGLAMSPDGKMVAGVTGNANVKIYDNDTREELAVIDLESPGTCAAFSPDGRILAVGTGFSLYLIDPAQKEIIGRIGNIGNNIWSIQFIDNNNLIAGDANQVMTINVPADKALVDAARNLREKLKKGH